MPKKPARKTKLNLPDLKTLLVLGGVFFIIAIFGYSYFSFRESEVEQEGIIVCRGDICEKSIHIHSELKVSICDNALSLPKEEGALADIHTHKESNILHFHERLRVSPPGEILDTSPLKLTNAVQALFGYKLTNTCIGQYCHGSLCPDGKPGRLTLRANGVFQKEPADYVWKDKDILELTFK